MKAIAYDRYGSADVLEFRDVAIPRIGDDDVLVQVRAAGVNRGAWHVMTGRPYPLRLAGFGVRAPKNPVLGMELAGIVAATGANVTRFRPGDEVFGLGAGAFAEFARAPQAKLAAKPASLTFEQAAICGDSAMTALQGLRDHAKVQSGQSVLITGASGGVGSFAVQIAVSFGAEVTGVASTAKTDFVRSLGAHEVIDYTRADVAASGRRYDAIFDLGGNASLTLLRRALAPAGTLVIGGGETGGRWLGGTDRQLRAMLLSPFVRQTLTTFICSENADDLMALAALIEAGTLTPALGATYPLVQAADALRALEQGRARGKLALTI